MRVGVRILAVNNELFWKFVSFMEPLIKRDYDISLIMLMGIAQLSSFKLINYTDKYACTSTVLKPISCASHDY